MPKFAWWWYFGGSFFDALIGPNIFIPGEPFLLAAGYLLHSGAIYGVIAVLLGGFCGDQISFAIGRRYGAKGRRWLGRHIHKTRRPMARTRLLLKQRGPLVVMAARLLGPVAWIMPFLAGSYAMPWRVFTPYSIIGLLAGVGQFILYGYLIAQGVEFLPDWHDIMLYIQNHILLTAVFLGIVCLVIASIVFSFYRRHQ